ncbi:hypothetical protein [Candidatus Villigracilis saccharophilus]|uniref:HEAT repeat domain-containing protein n=1 Tax=Candidatus Villigracilis saccharophilus TaxID=3140684 RepID=UPI003135129A|nr:hypothetical protein [Anaerolineales bacterium]
MNTFILCCFGISVLLGVYLLFQTVNAVAKNAHENSSSYKNTSYDQLSESYDGVKHLLRLAKANDKLAYSKLVNSNNPKIMNFLLTFIKEKNTSNADGELIYFTRPLFYQIGDMAIEPLFEIFLNDEVNRRSAAIALAFFGDKIVPRLLENINKHPYEVVITIVQMDKAIGNPVLISLLNHNDGYVSAQAASFLRSREVTVPQEMIDSLIVTYRNQEPTKLGGDLALTLYYLMGNKAFQIYKETYQSPNPYKRASIIRVVEERRENLNDASVLEFIYTSLVDSSSIVRQSALVAISKFPCRLEQIFPMLWKIYQEGDPVEMEYAWKSFYLSPDNRVLIRLLILFCRTQTEAKGLF